ncbi:MAG TPA: LacI family DNA-binding transcriptional regulator [Roseiarcus sp.]|nr:LacI family DNA-binding transcriptional regulator [Roseiarcus sp.]
MAQKSFRAPARQAAKRGGKQLAGALTMQKIAELAGVSAMTVSRALKSDASILPETRNRVLDIVSRIGYVPDATARIFASRRSGFIAALVPSLNNSNFAETVRGMEETFAPVGLQMLLGDTEYSLAREEDLIGAFLQRRPEAMVLTGGVHTARARQMLAGAGIPIVETWDLPKAPLDHVVGFSNEAAGAAMVRYLHGRGRRRIGFIGGATTLDTRGSERRAGYARAIRELGLPRGRIVTFGKPPVSMSQGAEALDLMLKQWPDVDAILCVSDLSAFGVLMECQRRGLDVPGQLAIAGFGDFEVARCCHPRLTTIAVDCQGIGRRAAEIALNALQVKKQGEALPPETVVMEFRVVARETA